MLKISTNNLFKVGDLSPNAGEASIANLDGVRFADGDIPTSVLRLKVQFQTFK